MPKKLSTPKPSEPGLREGWHSIVGLQFWHRVGDIGLQVGLSEKTTGGDWMVLALEFDATVGGGTVLDYHAHKYVGIFPLVEAIRRAEKYAKTWRPTLSSANACPCDDIPASKPRGRRRRRA